MAAALRRLADWIETHGLDEAELMVSVDPEGPRVTVQPWVFDEIVDRHGFSVDEDDEEGDGEVCVSTLVLDGVTVQTVEVLPEVPDLVVIGPGAPDDDEGRLW